MRLSRAGQKYDARVQQLLNKADHARVKKKHTEANALEAEADVLMGDEEPGRKLVPRQLLKDLKMRNKAAPASIKIKPAKPETTQKPKRLKLPAEEMMEGEAAEAKRDRSKHPANDRTKLFAALASMPYLAPVLQMNKGSLKSNSESEVTQFGLAGAGAGLMAVEPAAGGILLMFSCVFQALHDEEVDEPESQKKPHEPEQVEQMEKSGLFTAGATGMSWLIA